MYIRSCRSVFRSVPFLIPYFTLSLFYGQPKPHYPQSSSQLRLAAHIKFHDRNKIDMNPYNPSPAPEGTGSQLPFDILDMI